MSQPKSPCWRPRDETFKDAVSLYDAKPLGGATKMSLRIRGRRITLALSMTVVVSIVAVVFLAQSTSAALWPKNVRGTVWDNTGTPIANLPITINILKQSDLSIRATYTATTNLDGFYSKSVLAADWDIGDTIQILVTLRGDQGSNSSVANANPVQYVNVTFPYEIPDFGPGLMGIFASGAAIMGVGVALLAFWRRK
jgi:hypothetical protein